MNFKKGIVFLQATCFVMIAFSVRSQTHNYLSVIDHDITTIKGAANACSWTDFNNDGWVDLFIFDYSNQRNILYQNLGNGTFANYGSEPIVTDLNESYGGSWGDYNNDGYPDLFVSTYNGTNYLYRNNGSGFTTSNGFTKITNAAPVTEPASYAWDASWADYNNDGLLDIFVNTNDKNFLYKNLGNDEFQKITTGNIVSDDEASFAAAWGDYNNDGFVDLFVANFGNQNNSLYKNKGDGTFQKIVSGTIVNDGGQSRSASWGDYNNDGFIDLFVTNSGQQHFLYKNNGNETFTKITNDPIVNDDNWSYGSTWTDYDNDGYLDMAVINGTSNDSVSLFRNNGNGTFAKIDDASLYVPSSYSWTIAAADYNNDGYEDLYVASHITPYLFKNLNSANKFLSIKLKGVQSNASGIGARIRVKANNMWQTRQVASKSGRGGQGSLKSIFGMNQASSADSVVIYWPGNKRQILLNQATNRNLVVTECTPYNRTEARQINSDESFSFGSTSLTTAGTYTHTFLSKQGCDSTVALTLTVNPVVARPDVYVTNPADGSINRNIRLWLTAKALSGASVYTFEVSTSADFTGITLTKIGSPKQIFTGLSYNMKYYVRVKTDLSSVYGKTTSFTTGTAEYFTFITSPANAVVNRNVNLTLTSSTILGATQYTYELSTRSDFTGSTIITGTNQVAASNLAFKTKYFCRVKTNVSPNWGPAKYFTTGSPVSLSFVRSPLQNATKVSWTPLITTNDIGATSYTMQVSTDPNFGSVDFEQTAGANSIRFSGLAYDTKYYARVTTDLNGGVWGQVRTFTTNTPLNYTYITSPVNGATNLLPTVTVGANAVPTASTYYIQVDSSPAFDQAPVTKESASTKISFTLAYGTTYYVRVKTNLLPDSWSTSTSFTTASTTSLAVVTSPKNGATGMKQSITVSTNKLPGATSYTIELNTSPDFTGTSLVKTGTTNALIFSGLAASTTYYARVKTNLSGEWGSTTSFTTITTNGRQATEPIDIISEERTAQEITVFPNPFRTEFNVIISNPSEKATTILLRDNQGRVVYQGTHDFKSSISIGEQIVPGFYFLEVVQQEGRKVIKVIKE